MGCFGPDPPPMRDVAKEYQQTLNAQIAVAPRWYEMERVYRPRYAELDLGIAEKALPRLLSMYGQAAPALSSIESEDQRRRAEAEFALLQRLGPEATRTLRRASGTDELVNALLQEATAGIRQGADPRVVEELVQRARAGQAARGAFALGNPSASWEALVGAEGAQRWRQNAREAAQQAIGMAQMTGGDPLLTLLARPSQMLPVVPGTAQMAYATNPGNIFNPESPYAGNLYASNQAYKWQYQASQPSTLEVATKIGESVARVAAAAACWVAREVYGFGDLRWLVFAQWLRWKAPGWLRRRYLRHGPRWAEWLRRHPRWKRVVRWWMDGRVRTMWQRER